MKHKTIFSILIAAALASISAESRSVLIAYESTRFKDQLIEEMTKLLEDQGVDVHLKDHSEGELTGVSPDDYDAIFITNSGVNSQVRPAVSSWIESVSPASNILLHTTQRLNWSVESPVDIVTSASNRRETTALANEYTTKLLSLIKSDD